MKSTTCSTITAQGMFTLNNMSLLLTTGCENGTFGTECKSQCSGNCLYNVPCNSLSGHCDSGCASGYLDEFCSKSMYIRI